MYEEVIHFGIFLT